MVFPSQKQDEIRSMIDLQVGSRIPYSREEVEIDFQILSKTADGYSKVAVVIIPQEIAMRYWKIFSDAKIPVHGDDDFFHRFMVIIPAAAGFI